VSFLTKTCDRSLSGGVPRIAGTASGSHPLLGFCGDGQIEMRSLDIDADTDFVTEAI
jgi:hypothetical protein